MSSLLSSVIPSTAALVFLLWLIVCRGAEARRYRYCSEGCCLHEYCAYHKICYPKIHCHLGCPDGTCVENVCMPPAPCDTSTDCGMGRACQYHFNLGYPACQYNLDIGNTLCVDTKGRPLLQPMT